MSESTPMTVAVTGATGFVGRHTVRTLLERGHRVRALVRDSNKANDVLPLGDEDTRDRITCVTGDITDSLSCQTLVEGAGALVNTVGIRRELKPNVTFQRLHVLATKRLITAAHHHGVRRYLQVSALGVRAGATTGYGKSKFEAETLVRESGLAWTIVRPSLIHGPDGEFVHMVRDWVLGRSQPYAFIPYFQRVRFDTSKPTTPPKLESALVQPVNVRDVACFIADALASEEAIGEVYHLGGPERMTWPDVLETIRDNVPLATTKKPIIGLPGHLGVIAAQTAGILGLGEALPIGPSEPVMAMQDSICSNRKAHAHLGYEPSPFAESVKSYADKL